MPRVSSNGIELEYRSFGSRGRPLILISGLGAQLTSWPQGLIDALCQKGLNVIVFDNRDVGLSTWVDMEIPPSAEITAALKRGEQPLLPYHLSDMAADVVGLMEALDLPAAHLAGMSLGGAIAQVVAIDHPDRVLSLASLMSHSGNPKLSRPASDVTDALSQRLRPGQTQAEAIDSATRFAGLIGSPAYPIPVAKAAAAAAAAIKRAYNPAGILRQLAAANGSLNRHLRLATIAAPTLIIHGDSDRLVAIEGAEDAASRIADAQLLVLEGVGHNLPPRVCSTIATAIARNADRALQRNTTELRE